MFRKMPFILLALMIFVGVAHPWIPLEVQSVLYGVSLSLKSLIVFSLPLIIFGLLFKTAVGLAQKASKMILGIVVAICISNFFSTLLSYSVGRIAYGFDLSMPFPMEGAELHPAWSIALPQWIGNDRAMLAGLILGMGLGFWLPVRAAAIAGHVDRLVGYLLKGFLYVIPFFILGFTIKMMHDNVMHYIIQNYGMIFALTAFFVFLYIATLYFLASRGQGLARPQGALRHGSVGASAAAMPLTILGTEKNAQNSDLARSMIPATVNIHLIGDCFAIPIFAFAVMKSFGVAEPEFTNYLIFACYFVLAAFLSCFRF